MDRSRAALPCHLFRKGNRNKRCFSFLPRKRSFRCFILSASAKRNGAFSLVCVLDIFSVRWSVTGDGWRALRTRRSTRSRRCCCCCTWWNSKRCLLLFGIVGVDNNYITHKVQNPCNLRTTLDNLYIFLLNDLFIFETCGKSIFHSFRKGYWLESKRQIRQ